MTKTEDPKGGDDPKDPKNPNPGDDPKTKNGGNGEGEGDNPVELTDAHWDAVMKSRRFKSLNERAKLGEKLQKEKEDLERQKLADEGKIKELLEKEQKRAEAAETRLAEITRKGAISSAATKAGFVDPNDAPALIDPSKVEVDEDGNVTNADALVADLAKAKPHLVGKKPDIGNGGGGGDTPANGAGKRWKQSEIRKLSSDPETGLKWWEENKKDILAAQREGRIDLDG